MKKIITYICLFITLSASAQTMKDLQKQQQELEKEMAQTNKMLQQTKKNEKSTLNKLNLITQNLQTQRELINNLNSEITVIDTEITGINRKCDTLLNEQQALKKDYANLIRESHYNQMQQSPLLFLFSANNFQQLVRRARYLQEFAKYRQQQIERLASIHEELQTQNDRLQQLRSDKQTTLNTRKRQQDSYARDERKQKQMLNDLKKKEKDLTAKQQQQQKKKDELNKKIDELVRQQTQAKKNLTKEQQLINGNFEANKGKLPWPVEKGFISGQFGRHQHPVYEHVTIDNKGIYIQTTAGSYARSIYEGEVTSCFKTGNTYAVIIQHGNYRTVYSGLSSLLVKQGDKVKTKQNIGTIYSDADEDNKTELYFQIYNGSFIQNPTLWITK